MSEVRGDDQEFFRALEALHMDPFLGRIFDDVRARNKTMAETPLTKSEGLAIRDKIDEQWLHILNELVVFTGKISISRHQGGAKTEPKYYEDLECIFAGVELSDDDERNWFGLEDDAPRYYQLDLCMAKPREAGGVYRATARIEDIASLEFPDSMYPERARYILQNYEPKLLECIDYALNNPNEDESLTAMSLEGLVYSALDPDKDVTALVARALNTYVESNITFDTNIGYVISIDGEAWQHSGALLQIEAHTAPASIEGVEWRARPNDFQIAPHFRLHLSGKTSDDEPETLFVPLDAVSSVYSLRHKFWQDHNKNPSD